MTKMQAIGSLLVAAALATQGLAATSGTMSVQVKQGAVRATPSYTGQVLASLAYGDAVQVLETKPGWIKVSASGKTGWMHESALSKKKIVMSGSGATAQTGASSEEMALAGKGFNSDIEAQFKSQNKNLNYTAVDRMEKRSASRNEKEEFAREGGIR